MANLGPKGEGDNSMPGKQRSCPGARGEALRGPCDMAKARLPKPQSPDDAKEHPPETAPVTGAAACAGIVKGLAQPLGRKAMPNEGIEGDEWGAYVTLGRTKRTNAGTPTGREPQGDGVPVVVVRLTAHQGGRESRPQGKRAQVAGHLTSGRYA
jgi:hypothetical protein